MKSKGLMKWLWFGIFLLAPLLTLFLFFKFAEIPNDIKIRFGYGLAIYAWSWGLSEIIIASRPKFIERSVGFDNLLTFHILSVFAALIAGVLHRNIAMGDIFGVSGTKGEKIGELFFVISILLVLFASIFFTSLFSDKISFLKRLKRLLHRIDFQFYRIIHNVFIIIAFGFLLHVMNTSTLLAFPSAKLLFIIQFLIAFGFYLYHKIFKYFRKKNKFIVEETILENDKIVSIQLKSLSKSPQTFKPGQFLFIRFNNPSLILEEHPFTIASNPFDTNLSIIAKNLGNFSAKLLTLKPGVRAFIDYPYGNTYLTVDEEKTLVFIAGGIGITPFMSSLGDILHKNSQRPVFLLWGIKKQTDLIKPKFFLNLQENLENFQFVPVFSRSPESETAEKGYIDKEKIERIVDDQDRKFHYFICGPPNMMESVQKILKDLGIQKPQIHIEKFAM